MASNDPIRFVVLYEKIDSDLNVDLDSMDYTRSVEGLILGAGFNKNGSAHSELKEFYLPNEDNGIRYESYEKRLYAGYLLVTNENEIEIWQTGGSETLGIKGTPGRNKIFFEEYQSSSRINGGYSFTVPTPRVRENFKHDAFWTSAVECDGVLTLVHTKMRAFARIF